MAGRVEYPDSPVKRASLLDAHPSIGVSAQEGESHMGVDKGSQLALKIENVSVSLGGGTFSIDGLDLAAKEGEFLSLVGPSGCGKSTTLRLVAGLLKPDSGRVIINGADVTNIAPHRRGIGYVFQDHALWSHMTVRKHVEFALKYSKVPRSERAARVAEVLQLVHLDHHADRHPFELSGGQRQRVSIARALAPRPAMLLLDEPLSNLDRHLRDEMQREIRVLQQRLGTTALYVTHDRNEALAMSDRIAVLHEGTLQQVDTPSGIYNKPTNEYVARLLGPVNAIATKVAMDAQEANLLLPNGDSLNLPVEACTDVPPDPRDEVTMLIRPDNMALCDDDRPDSHLVGTVRDAAYGGSSSEYLIDVDSLASPLRVVERDHTRELGSRVGVRFEKVSFAEVTADVE